MTFSSVTTLSSIIKSFSTSTPSVYATSYVSLISFIAVTSCVIATSSTSTSAAKQLINSSLMMCYVIAKLLIVMAISMR